MSELPPPFDLQAEESILGALLYNGTAEQVESVNYIIRADDFYHQANKSIFNTLIKLIKKINNIDIISLTEELRRQKLLEAVGGASYIASLTSSVPSTANLNYYAEIIKKCSLRRKLLGIGYDIILESRDMGIEPEQTLEISEKKILEIAAEGIGSKDFNLTSDIVKLTVERIQQRYKNKDEYTGIPSGFSTLDRNTLGFQNSEMIIIGARPGVGKTAFALTIASYISLMKKISCGFFTLEMNALSLMNRLLASEAKVNSHSLGSGILSSEDWSRITQASEAFYDAPLIIDDTPNIRLLDLRSRARRMVHKHRVEIIIIDYLGLIATEDKKLPQHEQMAEISMTIKSLARELDIPVIALSQVGRQSEGKTPSLADLRGSGALEQDADLVLYLHRERENENESQSSVIETDLVIAKNRNGPVGTKKILFQPEYTRFVNMDTRRSN